MEAFVKPVSTKKIESPRNPVVKEASGILLGRGGKNDFIIEGPNLIKAAIESGVRIRTAFVTGGFLKKGQGKHLTEILSGEGVEIYEVTEGIFKKLSDVKSPQGISAVASSGTLPLGGILFKGVPLVVVGDGLKEPGNTGSLIRASHAFGADAVVFLSGTCNPFLPKSLRASAGSIFSIQIAYSTAESLVSWLGGKNITLFAATPRAGRPVFEADLRGPSALVFGGESGGLSRKMREAADFLFEIPMPGGAESLNVASSSAICLYEAMRQRAGGTAPRTVP